MPRENLTCCSGLALPDEPENGSLLLRCKIWCWGEVSSFIYALCVCINSVVLVKISEVHALWLLVGASARCIIHADVAMPHTSTSSAVQSRKKILCAASLACNRFRLWTFHVLWSRFRASPRETSCVLHMPALHAHDSQMPKTLSAASPYLYRSHEFNEFSRMPHMSMRHVPLSRDPLSSIVLSVSSPNCSSKTSHMFIGHVNLRAAPSCLCRCDKVKKMLVRDVVYVHWSR